MKGVSPKISGFLEYYIRSHRTHFSGAPFNGQLRRQEIFLELIKATPFAAIVETGTNLGTTTAYVSRESQLPIYTVESVPRYYYCSWFRLRHFSNIHLFLGDSRAFLERLSHDDLFPKERVLFYLDSHWQEDLPLREEVAVIAKSWSESVIIVDDFQVPDDKGYAFDDYGDGKRLCIEYLDPMGMPNLDIFMPAAPSDSETGLRRGCIVLATKGSTSRTLASLKSLRSIHPIH